MPNEKWKIALAKSINLIPDNVSRSQAIEHFVKLFTKTRWRDCLLCKNKVTGFLYPGSFEKDKFIKNVISKYRIKYKLDTVKGLICTNCIEKYKVMERTKKGLAIDKPNITSKIDGVKKGLIKSLPFYDGTYRQKQKIGYIYIIECQGMHKIGRAKNLNGRFKRYQTENPYPVDLIFAHEIHDYIKKETEILHKFQLKNIHGEWFNLTKDDIFYIKECVNQGHSTALIRNR